MHEKIALGDSQLQLYTYGELYDGWMLVRFFDYGKWDTVKYQDLRRWRPDGNMEIYYKEGGEYKTTWQYLNPATDAVHQIIDKRSETLTEFHASFF